MIATEEALLQVRCQGCGTIRHTDTGKFKAGVICGLPFPKGGPMPCGGIYVPYYPDRHCSNGPAAKATAARLLDSVQMLAGCVIEMMEKNPAMVLSPVMRRLLLDQAKALDAMLPLVGPAICVDIPEGALEGASWLKSA